MSIRDALNKASTADPFAGFLPVNIDTTGAVQYFGFMACNGAWIIKQYAPDDGVMAYTGGDSGYAAAWDDRLNITYTLPDGTI